jgi:hypothetical protein
MTGFRFMQQLLEAATHAVARCLAVAYTKRLSTVPSSIERDGKATGIGNG